jgi:hypothetical protein
MAKLKNQGPTTDEITTPSKSAATTTEKGIFSRIFIETSNKTGMARNMG